MSKKKSGQFTNRAARKFADMAKVDLMSQAEIYDILDQDMPTILGQVTAFTSHAAGAQYPAYIANGFANLATTLYFKEFVEFHVNVKDGKLETDLTKEDIKALRMIVADAYKKSATNYYANQVQEYADRNEMLAKTFKRLSPKMYKRSAQFEGLSKTQRRDLIIQVYGDPVYNMKFVHKIVNQSTNSDKRNLKLLKKLYGDRFLTAVGAAMTVEGNNSDCLAMLFEYTAGLNKKKRKKVLREYATAYKKNRMHYFRMDAAFAEENHKLIRDLIWEDIGYKKAFDAMQASSKSKSQNPKKH